MLPLSFEPLALNVNDKFNFFFNAILQTEKTKTLHTCTIAVQSFIVCGFSVENTTNRDYQFDSCVSVFNAMRHPWAKVTGPSEVKNSNL